MRSLKSLTSLFLAISIGLLGVVSPTIAENNKPIHFTIIGDRTGGAVEGVYEKVILQAERLKPDFMITVGDMIVGYTADTVQLNKEFNEILAMYEPVKVPVYFTPGNHDITYDDMEPFYKKYFGEPYFSTDFESVHIIVLDNSRWEKSIDLPSEQLEWLENDLKANQNAAMRLVFMHKPFWYNSLAMGKEDILHNILKEHNVNAVFCGHFHTYFANEYDGIKYTTVGSSGGGYGSRPGELGFHFAYVTVNGSEISIVPIKADAVLASDVRSVEDVIRGNQNRYLGIEFLNGVEVNPDMTIKNAKVSMRIANFNPSLKVDDTLKWTVPDGWTIEPEKMPISLPESEKVVEFTVSSTGPLYPLPEVSFSFPFSEYESQNVSKPLCIRKVANCMKQNKEPVIDGSIKAGEWRNPHTEMFASDGNKTECDPTEFYFSYDNDHLYLAAKCYDKNIDSLAATTTDHDGPVYSEDCVGYFIKPAGNDDFVYQIYFNPLGIAFDQIIWQAEDGYHPYDKSWNGEYVVATGRGDGYWSVEVEIPLEQFDLQAESGSDWPVNFRRKQKRLGKTANWQAPIDYNPETFGLLRFQ